MTDTPTRKPRPLYDRSAIVEALGMILPGGQVTELRALDATTARDRWPCTHSGYFDDLEKLASAVGTIKSAIGVYFIPNPVDPALLARAANRIRKAVKGQSTQDSHIVRRRWLLIDADAQRPSGISATDAEHEAAIERARAIYRYLKGQGWPDPIVADSGNGAHLLYLIDLPAGDNGLVQRCLIALAQRFDDAAVKVDQTVFNPARIWKLYGTLTCKGDNTPERPHRMARVLNLPAELVPVPVPKLEALAGEAGKVDEASCQPSMTGKGQLFDVPAFIAGHKLDVTGPEPWNGQQGAGRRWVFGESPICEHNEGAAFILEHGNGAISAGCHHNSCSWSWPDLRAKLEPDRQHVVKMPQKQGDDAPITVDDPWPEPIDPAAMHGLAGDVVAAIEPHSEADPVALLVQLLVAFGNVIGRGAYFMAENDWHRGNLFACLVGVTSKGRKGSSWGRVGGLFAEVDAQWRNDRVMGGLSSGEGLTWAVRDAISKREPVREGKGKNARIIAHQDVVVDDGVDDKRLLVLEGEFASVLKVVARERNTLSAIIRQAWDSGALRTMTKNSPAKATGAHISIVGHITRDELRRLITETDLANGLANRFLWVCVKRSKFLPEGGRLRESELTGLTTRLLAAVDFAKADCEVRRDEAARAVWCDVYPTLSAGTPGLLGAATSRAEAQVMRLAMLYALLDESAVIRPEHLMAGLAAWTYCEQSARYIFGSALGDPTADEILTELRRRHPKGMTRTQIRELLHRNKPSGEINRALSVLLEYDLAVFRKQDTAGRPAEVWFAVQ